MPEAASPKVPLTDQPAADPAAGAASNGDLARAEADVYGADAIRDRDGKPLEKGSGSAYAQASQADKAHLATLEVRAVVLDVEAAARVLLDATKRMTDAVKAAVDASASAKAERAADTKPA